jgi:hypothetical protein
MHLPDTYTWSARIAPLGVVVSPIFVLASSAAVVDAPVPYGALAIASVLFVLAGQLGRDAGKRIQPELWNKWGGPPTLQRMRFRNAISGDKVRRLHERVAVVTLMKLPTDAEERDDPAGSDELYEEALASLRELTRDHQQFQLLFHENVNYGFRRNLLGLRPLGIGISVLALAGSVAFFLIPGGSTGHRVVGDGISAVYAALVLAILVAVVNADWVRAAAEEYADRLLASTEQLRR